MSSRYRQPRTRANGSSNGNKADRPKPKPLDLTHHFSKLARRYTETAASQILAGVSLADLRFQLGPGFPFAGNFPVDTLEGAIAEPRRFPLYPVGGVSLPSTDTERFTVPKVSLDAQSGNPSSQIDLSTALQYQQASGLPSLAAFVQDWALNYQNQGKIPYRNPETLLTLGAADAWAKCLQAFVDPGDRVLVEEYVYTSARDQIPPFGAEIVGVPVDDEGMSAQGLEHILASWNERVQGKRPRLMYTVTLGQNPTGAIMSISRKRKIYKLCQKYDILVCEDDPYWSLQYDIPDSDDDKDDGKHGFLSRLAPSYLTIDVDGRVLGLQTFTKIFAPGSRVGWIVAQPDFIEKLTIVTEGTTQNPSGFAEAALAQIIVREWGIPGFIRWIEGLRVNYKSRRDVFCEALAEGRDIFIRSGLRRLTAHNGHSHVHSSKKTKRENTRKRRRSISTHDENDNSSDDGSSKSRAHRRKVRVYDFDVPAGGMYVWVDVNIAEHPLSQPAAPGKPHLSPEEIMLRLWNHLMSPPYLLLSLPGTLFAATPDVTSAVTKLRLTFVAVPAADCRRAARAFSEGIKSFWEGAGWELPTAEEMRRLASLVKTSGGTRWAGHLLLKDSDDTLSKVMKNRFLALMNIDLASLDDSNGIEVEE